MLSQHDKMGLGGRPVIASYGEKREGRSYGIYALLCNRKIAQELLLQSHVPFCEMGGDFYSRHHGERNVSPR